MSAQCLVMAALVGVDREIHARGGIRAEPQTPPDGTWIAEGSSPDSTATSLASSELGGSKSTVLYGVARVQSGSVRAPDREQVCAAERDILLCDEQPYILSSIIDLARLDACCLEILGRGQGKNIGEGGDDNS